MRLWLYTLGSVTLVSLLSLVGIVGLARDRAWLDRILLYLVALATGVLLGSAVIHLIPHGVHLFGEGGEHRFALWFLLGFLGFYFLERYLWTHEHAPPPLVPVSGDFLEDEMEAGDPSRSEEADAPHHHDGNHRHPVVTMNLIGDGVHNFIDGALIAGAYAVEPSLGIATTLGVMAHEIPQEIGDFGVLVYGGTPPRRALLLNFLTAAMAIAGAIAALLAREHAGGLVMALVPVAAGNFVYIAAADLIPELHRHRGAAGSTAHVALLVGGVGLMFLLSLWVGGTG